MSRKDTDTHLNYLFIYLSDIYNTGKPFYTLNWLTNQNTSNLFEKKSSTNTLKEVAQLPKSSLIMYSWRKKKIRRSGRRGGLLQSNEALEAYITRPSTMRRVRCRIINDNPLLHLASHPIETNRNNTCLTLWIANANSMKSLPLFSPLLLSKLWGPPRVSLRHFHVPDSSIYQIHKINFKFTTLRPHNTDTIIQPKLS